MLESSRETSPLPREIAVRFIPVIRKAAHRLARRLPPHVCVEDLTGAGFIGLVDAYRKYDASRCDRFEPYAEYRIRGAMLDELRSYDPLSRDLRSHVSRTGAATRLLESRLGRAPTEAEIAAELGLTVEAFRTYSAKAAIGPTVSLDVAGHDDEPVLEVGDASAPPADERLHHARSREALGTALAALPPRLRQVVELYYGDELTLRDIGGILGVTESRVCQLHAEAIARLKSRCAGEAEPVKQDPSVGAKRPSTSKPRRATAAAARAAARPAPGSVAPSCA